MWVKKILDYYRDRNRWWILVATVAIYAYCVYQGTTENLDVSWHISITLVSIGVYFLLDAGFFESPESSKGLLKWWLFLIFVAAGVLAAVIF